MTRRNAVEGEMEEELRFHLERQVEKYVATVAAQKGQSTPRKIHERPLDAHQTRCFVVHMSASRKLLSHLDG